MNTVTAEVSKNSSDSVGIESSSDSFVAWLAEGAGGERHGCFFTGRGSIWSDFKCRLTSTRHVCPFGDVRPPARSIV